MTLNSLLNTVHHADCFDLLAMIPDGAVDAVITDPPYNVHEASWDTALDLPRLWTAIERVLKPNGTVIFTAVMSFAVDLICSKREWFKYDLVWAKNKKTDFLNAKNKPMRAHEQVLIFSPGTTANGSERRMYYSPQMVNAGKSWRRKNYATTKAKSKFGGANRKTFSIDHYHEGTTERFPNTLLMYDCKEHPLHPNEKPVELFQWLVKSYTPPGAIVCDPFMGSGTTAVAARNTGRRFIAGDSSAEYVAIARDRLRMPFEPRQVEPKGAPLEDLPLFAIGD